MANENSISICLGDFSIVAEIYNHDETHPECVISLQDKNGCVFQDIALIRPHEDELKCSADKGAIDCLIWRDTGSEDYTDKFVIDVYDGEY